jgi:hypothetical protein
MSKRFYAFLAHFMNGFHAFWTFLVFGGGVLVLFYHPYALVQIDVMTLTGIFWFAFGLRCCLTIWAAYFEKKAGIHNGDARPFTPKKLEEVFKIKMSSKMTGFLITLFYVASYTTSVLAILGRLPF